MAVFLDRFPAWGYWVHYAGARRFAITRTGPGKEAHRRTAHEYLRSIGIDPSSLQDPGHLSNRGTWHFYDQDGAHHCLSFWFDLDWASSVLVHEDLPPGSAFTASPLPENNMETP